MAQHVPVMLAESLEYLAIQPDGIYCDATAGLGGHTAAIASRLSSDGLLISCDRDEKSLSMAQANAAEFADRIDFRHTAFSRLEAEALGGRKLNGLLADLGVSRYQ